MDKKIYHYDAKDGFYLGSEIIYKDQPIPYVATDIPPPATEEWPSGFVPVFCADSMAWSFEKNEFWQVDLDERCFYTGRDSDGPIYLVADPSSQSYQLDLMKYGSKLPIFSLPRIGASPNALHLGQRIDFINACITQLEAYWWQTKTGGSIPMFGQGASHYHFFTESLVGAVRRLLDDLTTVIFLKLFQKYEPWKRNLAIDGFSALLGKTPHKRVKEFFRTSEKGVDTDLLCEQFVRTILGGNSVFLTTIQGLSNSYKHSVTANAVRSLHGLDHPTILTVGVADIPPRCNLGRLVFHNHSLRQLVLGLADYLDDLVVRVADPLAAQALVEKCTPHRVQSIKSILNGPHGV